MRKLTRAILPTAILVAGIIAAPALYAQSDRGSSGSMMGHGMMDDNNRNDGGGMMKMMGQMSRMMDHCNNMMSDSRPNDQWRKDAPSEPKKKE
ncbi:hypothetical protein ACF1BQ_006345 [Bradyrhizobium sp. RDT10]